MPRFADARNLRRMWDDKSVGPRKTYRHLSESLEAGRAGKPGGLRFRDFSIRNLFEELVPDGRELLRLMEYGRRGGSGTDLMEASNAVDTSAFTAIVGQLAFSAILEGFENPAFIWPQLCTVKSTKYLWGEKIPGIAKLGDVAEVVDEGKPYPTVGTSQEYVETQPLKKRGFIVPVTREITIADNTGLLIERCSQSAQVLGFSREKRVVDLAVGVTNNYKRNGTATNTYLTSGAYVNSQSNTLVDYHSVETALLAFDALSDPNTGEPILVQSPTLLVPRALEMTARRILTATQVEHVDNQVAASTFRTFSGNPLPSSYSVLTSPYVKRRTNSASTWFMGDFMKAFALMEAWGIEQDQLGRGSHLAFHNDVVYEFKGSMMDQEQVIEPRFVTKNT